MFTKGNNAKNSAIKEFSSFTKNKAVAFLSNKGLNAAEIYEMRNLARNAKVGVHVIKNRLAKIALAAQGIKSEALDKFKGPGLFFVAEDFFSLTSSYSDVANLRRKVSPIVLMDEAGFIAEPKQLKSLSRYKNRPTFIASFIYSLKLPLTKLVLCLHLRAENMQKNEII